MIRHLTHEPIDVIVSTREVARLLGYPPGPVPERVEEMIAQARRQAPMLLRPAAAFALLGRDEVHACRYLDGAEQAAVALVTIGDGVERAVARYRDEGLLAPALIFDAFGSAAVEAAADRVEEWIGSVVAADGHRCSRRFSPGYGGWDVADQRWILPAVDAAALGVTLTEGCMMIPRKSVTFAVTIGENPIELREEDICESCGAPDCEWRGTPQRCQRRPIP